MFLEVLLAFKLRKDAQMRFEIAKAYREHVDLVKKDRELEEYFQVSWESDAVGMARSTEHLCARGAILCCSQAHRCASTWKLD